MKNKKKLFMVCGIVVGIIVAALVIDMFTYRFVWRKILPDKSSNDLGEIERVAKIMETSRPTDVYLYGEEIDFDNQYSPQQMDQINEQQLSDNQSQYTVCIINDLDDSIELNQAEIDFLGNWFMEDGHLLIYLGTKYSTTWDDTSKGIVNVDGNLYYSYYSWSGKPYREIGGWNETDQVASSKYPTMLGQSVMSSIESYIQ